MTDRSSYPCVLPVEQCPNKRPDPWVCRGQWNPRCYVNWGFTDAEGVEPYEEHLKKVEEP